MYSFNIKLFEMILEKKKHTCVLKYYINHFQKLAFLKITFYTHQSIGLLEADEPVLCQNFLFHVP